MSNVALEQARQLASDHHNAGRFVQAIEIYQRLLAADPTMRLHNSLGHALLSLGQIDRAISVLTEGTRVHPEDALTFSNLGVACYMAGQIDPAIKAYRRAVELNPRDHDALCNLAVALGAAGQFDEAANAARRAGEISPESPRILQLLGNLLLAQDRLEAAEPIIRRALALAPADPLNALNLGTLLQRQGHLDAAADMFRRISESQPNFAEAHGNLGGVLLELGCVDAANFHFQRATELKPSFTNAHSDRLLSLHYRPVDRAEYVEAHHRWEQQEAKRFLSLRGRHGNDRTPNRRLRVAYLSADFRMHSVNYFFAPLLAAHDRAAVETYCYSSVKKPDAATAELQGYAGHWRDVARVSDVDLLRQIRDDRIDILVDLSLHTPGNRLAALAARPAPVQVSYLGYTATAGLSYIDYRITDAVLDPPTMTETWNSETLMRLPGGFCAFRPPKEAPEIAGRPASDDLVFGSFNTLAKLSDQIFLCWCEILRQMPQSRLLIQTRGADQPSVRARLNAMLRSRGLRPDRLILTRGGSCSMSDYLRALSMLDIALDSFPYNGQTTSCHALWMGVPVVSLAGPTSISRVGLSLLSSLSLADLAASDADEYVRTAVTLSRSHERRAELRRTLRTRMRNSPLLDGLRLASEIEAAYREMWVRWCSTPGR